ncbi:chorismate mutase [Pseudemcibacter aquimaris]|uniref:chorismate mutase n=1 Tax=Pseudemcibacter aquimaris TaxID=2857064 RepID=UPI0020121D93|nr:chorismate mutase [Pseudemcibacter aquimaris]MCC3861110.1 chorismate mutase [Pseudemcibacter aquimaris]WDU59928.1 chorismate mutase [Pseudemcibacter aquimaris]
MHDELKNKLGLKADNCQTMADLREEIDLLDRTIVEMFAIRQTYMDQAANIKQSRDTVRDNDRVEDVVAKVKAHAEKNGANPELTEELYRTMIEWSINYEFGKFDEIKGK